MSGEQVRLKRRTVNLNSKWELKLEMISLIQLIKLELKLLHQKELKQELKSKFYLINWIRN